ncbi:MAG: serine O-acetyltransferase [Chthoniobacter sp.]|uniref:serine O-acetyltransferase n=1 Tax=Chthoniobacter sp. TaxID=2510640 RepID=UPI0032A3FB2F
MNGREGLEAFLAKSFETHFTRPPEGVVRRALELYEQEKELIATDVHSRYPATVARSDFDEVVAEVIEIDARVQATLFYRIARGLYLHDATHPFLPYLAYLMRAKTGAEIYYSADIGPRLNVEHGMGIVVGPRHRIGSDFTIYQGVTLGQRRVNSPDEKMVIGDHCTVFSGAKLFGTITLGDHVRVAANAVLLTDAEAYSTYAGVPAVKVKVHQP